MLLTLQRDSRKFRPASNSSSNLARWCGPGGVGVALVVLLKGVNVGGGRTFRPSMLAGQLKHLDAVSIGAAGTFVIRRPVSRAHLLSEFARRLPFDARIMICQGREIVRLTSRDFFSGDDVRPDIVRFVSVPVSVSSSGATDAHEPSLDWRVAGEDSGQGEPVRRRVAPAADEGHRLSRRVGPDLRRTRHDAQLEYHHCDRQGVGCGAIER